MPACLGGGPEYLDSWLRFSELIQMSRKRQAWPRVRVGTHGPALREPHLGGMFYCHHPEILNSFWAGASYLFLPYTGPHKWCVRPARSDQSPGRWVQEGEVRRETPLCPWPPGATPGHGEHSDDGPTLNNCSPSVAPERPFGSDPSSRAAPETTPSQLQMSPRPAPSGFPRFRHYGANAFLWWNSERRLSTYFHIARTLTLRDGFTGPILGIWSSKLRPGNIKCK